MKEIVIKDERVSDMFYRQTIDKPTRIILPNAKWLNSFLIETKILAPVEIVAPKALTASYMFNDTDLQAPVKLTSPYVGLFKYNQLFAPYFEGSTFDGIGETAKNLYDVYYSDKAIQRIEKLGEEVNKTLEKLRKEGIFLRLRKVSDYDIDVGFYNTNTKERYTPQTETEKLIMDIINVYLDGYTDDSTSVHIDFGDLDTSGSEKYMKKINVNMTPTNEKTIMGYATYGLNTKEDLKALVDLYDFIQGKRRAMSSFSNKILLVKSVLTKTKNPPIATALHRAAKSNFAQVLRKVICK